MRNAAGEYCIAWGNTASSDHLAEPGMGPTFHFWPGGRPGSLDSSPYWARLNVFAAFVPIGNGTRAHEEPEETRVDPFERSPLAPEQLLLPKDCGLWDSGD